MKYLRFVWLLALGVSQSAWPAKQGSDLPDWVVRRIEPVHYGLNQLVDDTSRSIDRFFGTDESIFADNQSYIRLGQEISRAEGDTETRTSFRFRLDLPTTRQKLRLVFESDANELDGESGSRNSTLIRNNEEASGRADSSLGLEVRNTDNETESWDGRAGVGIRFSSGVDPYVRYTASRRWVADAENGWNIRSFNRLSYFDKRETVLRNTLDFSRPLTETSSLRFLTQTEYEERRDAWYYSQSAEINQILDDRSAVKYALIALGDTEITPSLYDYVIQYFYRRDIHNRFIFLDLIPEIHFPQNDDRDPFVSVTVRVEMFFRGDFGPTALTQ